MRPGGGRAVELVLGAGRGRAVLGLVRVVQAIVISVADPSLRNAALVLAGEVPGVGASWQRRFGVRVRAASLAVRVQPLAVGAATPGRDADAGGVGGNRETELLAAAVVQVARVARDDGLSILAVDPDAVEPVALLHLLNNLLAISGDLVHLDDGVQTPVSDVKLVRIDDQGEGVSDHP